MAQRCVVVRYIKAVADDGSDVTIVEIKPTDFQRTINGGLVDMAPPFTIFELTNGEPVNHRQDGTYEVVRTHQILRKIT